MCRSRAGVDLDSLVVHFKWHVVVALVGYQRVQDFHSNMKRGGAFCLERQGQRKDACQKAQPIVCIKVGSTQH
jgi:hypothetical protein